MKLELKRKFAIRQATIGELRVLNDEGNVIFACNTLEHLRREKKIKGITAIAAGTYKVKYSMSSKYKKLMPYLLDVPEFSGIMIHTGNTLDDTEGCILVGHHTKSHSPTVYNSKMCFNMLDTLIRTESRLQITIEDPL